MRHLSAGRGNAFRNYLASTWRHSISWTLLYLMAAMIVCPSAHAFVTAADFNGLESGIESGNIDRPLGIAVDGNGNVYIAQSSVVLKETLSPDGSGYSESVITRIEGAERVGIAVDGVGNVYLGMNGGVYKETLFRRQLPAKHHSFQCQAARLDRGGRQRQCVYRRQRG